MHRKFKSTCRLRSAYWTIKGTDNGPSTEGPFFYIIMLHQNFPLFPSLLVLGEGDTTTCLGSAFLIIDTSIPVSPIRNRAHKIRQVSTMIRMEINIYFLQILPFNSYLTNLKWIYIHTSRLFRIEQH